MDLHKFGIKFFAADAERIDILKLIPIYHRWIQQSALEDLLIDVADYSHVPAGPGVMLIAHEGNYALDETGHERGVVYYSKHKLDGRPARAPRARRAQSPEGSRAHARGRRARRRAEAARQPAAVLRQRPAGRSQHRRAYAEIEPALKSLPRPPLRRARYTWRASPTPRSGLSVRVQADGEVSLPTLIARLT